MNTGMTKAQFESIKVGTKVRITNVAGILFGSMYFSNGDVVECVGFHKENEPEFGSVRSPGSSMTILFNEKDSAEIVEEAQATELKVGDKAIVTGNGDKGPGAPHGFAIGTEVEILWFAEADNGPAAMCADEQRGHFGVATADLRKVAAEPKPERIVKVGDKVVLNKADDLFGSRQVYGWNVDGQGLMDVGAIGEVTHVRENAVVVKFDVEQPGSAQEEQRRRFVIQDGFYEVVKENKPNSHSSPTKEGDIVVITANTNFSRNKVGDIGKVGPLDGSRSVKVDVPGRTGGNGNWTYFTEMRPATDAEKAQYEKAVVVLEAPAVVTVKKSIEVGDIVVIDSADTYESKGSVNSVGDIGKVARDNESLFGGEKSFAIEVPGKGTTVNNHGKADVRLATEEEKVQYDSEVSPKPEETLKAGDFITLDTAVFKADNTEGKAYEVKKDSRGLYFDDDVQDRRHAPITAKSYTKVETTKVIPQTVVEDKTPPQTGDIVRITNTVSWKTEEEGLITEVVHGDGSMVPKVRYSDGEELYAGVEIVARKKDRLDLK